jgi:hypothetical protein
MAVVQAEPWEAETAVAVAAAMEAPRAATMVVALAAVMVVTMGAAAAAGEAAVTAAVAAGQRGAVMMVESKVGVRVVRVWTAAASAVGMAGKVEGGRAARTVDVLEALTAGLQVVQVGMGVGLLEEASAETSVEVSVEVPVG